MCPLQTKSELKEKLLQTIKRSGTFSFAEFMEMALYEPEVGYYQKCNRDDYYTSADVHSIFGELLAYFFYEQWKKKFRNSKENEFYLIELGCGNGKLAKEILSWLSVHAPDFFSKLLYVGIEISWHHKNEAEKLLEPWKEKIEIQEDFSFPEHFINGIVFSNEFFDALPFDRVIMKNGELKEIRISLHFPENSDQFTFKEVTVEPFKEIKEYFEWLGVYPKEDCIAETHLSHKFWMAKIASALRKGTILTIDYGFEAEELYSEIRTEGTALCHFQHQTNRNFYENIGDQDITAHVNFTTLMKEAEAWGIRSEPLKTQSQFLIENGLDEMLKAIQKNKSAQEQLKLSSAIKSLIHPEGMGSTFKVLTQHKL